MTKKTGFEADMTRLEEIVQILEKGESGLEEALALFEEASALARSCSVQLAQAEQKVLQLTKGADGAPVEAPFAVGGQA